MTAVSASASLIEGALGNSSIEIEGALVNHG